MKKTPDIDMSPAAVQRRLEKVADLLRACRELAKFKIIGRVEQPAK